MTTGSGIALAGMWLCVGMIAQADMTIAAVLVVVAVAATLPKLRG